MSTQYNRPTSLKELYALQKSVRQLLREQRLKVALNKLCPRHKDDDAVRIVEKQLAVRAQYKSDDHLISAAGEPAPATAERYRKRALAAFADAVQVGRDVWALVEERSGNADSWYTFKAGMQFFLMGKVAKALEVVDKWDVSKRNGEPEPFPRTTYNDAVRLMPPLATALAATPTALPDKFKGSGGKKQVNSKSKSIRRRPDDWREQVAAIMEGNLKLLFLMQCVTGCRPVELEKGISVVLLPNGELEFSVVGAKLGKHAGQPVRKGSVDAQAGVASELAKLLQVGNAVNSAPLMGRADTYRKQVSRHCDDAFPEKNSTRRLSAYSARHQLRADLRGAGLSREKTAEMMGHSTTKSATYYGTGGRAGKGAVKLKQVSAARPIKQRAAYPGQVNRIKAAKAPSCSPVAPIRPKPRG